MLWFFLSQSKRTPISGTKTEAVTKENQLSSPFCRTTASLYRHLFETTMGTAVRFLSSTHIQVDDDNYLCTSGGEAEEGFFLDDSSDGDVDEEAQNSSNITRVSIANSLCRLSFYV